MEFTLFITYFIIMFVVFYLQLYLAGKYSLTLDPIGIFGVSILWPMLPITLITFGIGFGVVYSFQYIYDLGMKHRRKKL